MPVQHSTRDCKISDCKTPRNLREGSFEAPVLTITLYKVMLGALPIVVTETDLSRAIESEGLKGKKYKFSDAFLHL